MAPRVIPHAMRFVCLAAVCAALLTWPHTLDGSQALSGSADESLREFHNKVERYGALHRRLEGPLPPRLPPREAFSTVVERQLLASAIRRARASARAGDIIDPAAARVLRAIVASVYAAPGGAALAQQFQRRAARPLPNPVVNEPYAMDVASTVPRPILEQLPALTDDLEYRAVNGDLVLWDIHAGIVVDLLPGALLPES